MNDYGTISMSESFTDEALRYLRRSVFPSEEEVKLAALSFANLAWVGGNYSDAELEPVPAQEEAMCRVFPALGPSMASCPATEKSRWEKSNGGYMWHYNKYVFGAGVEGKERNVLFTEEVECRRPSDNSLEFQLLKDPRNRVKAGFVEAAAPIFGRGEDARYQKWTDHPGEWYEKTFLNVFYAPKSVDERYNAIVVGPWGSGAFGNDPEVVARSFVNVIKKHDLRKKYREIHFCLGKAAAKTEGGRDATNVEVFRRVLKEQFVDQEVADYTTDLRAKETQWMKEEKACPSG